MAAEDAASPYITVVCPTCGTRLSPRREAAGRLVRCPDCHVAVRVPQPPAEAPKRAPLPTPGAYDMVEGGRVPIHLRGAATDSPDAGGPSSDDRDRSDVPDDCVLAVCGTCGTRLHPKAAWAGRRVRCPDCGQPVPVPQPTPKRRSQPPKKPVGQYRVGDEGNRNLVMPTISTARRMLDAVPEAAPLPRAWFWTGLFSTLVRIDVLSAWLILALMFLIVGEIFAVGLYFAMRLGPGDYLAPFMVVICLALGVMLAAITAGRATTYFLTVLEDVSSGYEQEHEWPGITGTEFFRAAFFVVPFMVAGTIGYGVVWLVEQWVVMDWQTSTLATVGIAVLIYPPILLSVLEGGSLVSIVNPAVLRLFAGAPLTWLVFYIESAVLIFAWIAATAAVGEYSLFLAPLVAAPLAAALVLIIARLLGRTVRRAGEKVAERAERHEARQAERAPAGDEAWPS